MLRMHLIAGFHGWLREPAAHCTHCHGQIFQVLAQTATTPARERVAHSTIDFITDDVVLLHAYCMQSADVALGTSWGGSLSPSALAQHCSKSGQIWSCMQQQ